MICLGIWLRESVRLSKDSSACDPKIQQLVQTHFRCARHVSDLHERASYASSRLMADQCLKLQMLNVSDLEFVGDYFSAHLYLVGLAQLFLLSI